MTRLVARRVLLSVLTFALASALIFTTTEILPGDVATSLLGRDATPQAVAALRTKLRLDQSALARYWHLVSGELHGDLGRSLATGQPIGTLLGQRLRNTLLLGGLAAAIGIALALAFGTLAGLTRDKVPDLLISTVALIGISIPEFVVGSLLILVVAIKLRLLPAVTTVAPDAPLKDLLPNVWLPAATLVVVMMAWIIRMVRTSVIEAARSDFAHMARLKGLSRTRVVLRHVLPNALLPTINVVALTLAWLVGGVVIVEAVFNYPGVGTLTVQAVQNRDLPLIQAIGLLGAAATISINLAADLLALALNPRLRTMRG